MTRYTEPTKSTCRLSNRFGGMGSDIRFSGQCASNYIVSAWNVTYVDGELGNETEMSPVAGEANTCPKCFCKHT